MVPTSGPVPGTLRFEWIDPNGSIRDLTGDIDTDLFVYAGSKGLGVPEVEIIDAKMPSTPGSQIRHVKLLPVTVELPVLARGADFGTTRTQIDNLRRWFYTGSERHKTPGYLRVTRPQDGVERQMSMYYVGGLEGDLENDRPNHAPMVIKLFGPDPFWTDIEATDETYDESHISLTQSIINVGDEYAYPIITIAGPASSIVFTNYSTGAQMAFSGNGGLSLSAGVTLTIDTRPNSMLTTLPVLLSSGTNAFPYLSPQSTLQWWLRPGQNLFAFAMSGTTVATTIGIQWIPRYLGVL